MQALGPVGDDQQAEIDPQAALNELAEKRGPDLPALRGGLQKAEQHFCPEIVTPSATTISSSANVLPSSSTATTSWPSRRRSVCLLQPARGRALEAARHPRGTQPKGLGHRFRAPLVFPRRETAQDLVQLARVERPRLLQPLIPRQRGLLVPQPIAHARYLDRNLLIR